MLDPAPRVVLDPEIGMLAVGATASDSQIASDIYYHTMPVLTRAEDHLGGYQALPEGDSSKSSTGSWNKPNSGGMQTRRHSRAWRRW